MFVDSVEFPSALGETLRLINSALSDSAQSEALAGKILVWISPLVDRETLTPELKKVLSSMLRKLNRVAGSSEKRKRNRFRAAS